MLTKEQKNGAIAIALRSEIEDYKDEILCMIFQTLAVLPESEATEIFDFWVTYRPWTIKLAHALIEFEERTRETLIQLVQETPDFISYKL